QGVLQGAGDLHDDEQRGRQSTPGFEPADGALADPGAAAELLLRQPEELTHTARVSSEAPHPFLPRVTHCSHLLHLRHAKRVPVESARVKALNASDAPTRRTE